MSRFCYPPDIKDVRERREELMDFFAKHRFHKGVFLDILELQGSFLCDDPGLVYDTLKIGERLILVPDQVPENTKLIYPNPLISVKTAYGTEIGMFPLQSCILPNALIRRGVGLFAFLECKEFESCLLATAVSVYCDNYNRIPYYLNN